MPETVITTGASSKVVHTDPDCPMVRQATGLTREARREHYAHRPICKRCKNGPTVYNGGHKADAD